MGIDIINPREIALRERERTVVMNTRKMHAWVHYYPNPGDHDELHRHNEDQVFTCFKGECTMRFPDGGLAVLKPGMAALITGGSFYQLENTGNGHMVLMGHRSGNQDNVMHIDYVTRQDIRKSGGPKVRNRATGEFPSAGRTRCGWKSVLCLGAGGEFSFDFRSRAAGRGGSALASTRFTRGVGKKPPSEPSLLCTNKFVLCVPYPTQHNTRPWEWC